MNNPPGTQMHTVTPETIAMFDHGLGYARWRMTMHDVPLDGAKSMEELRALIPPTVTEEGLGSEATFALVEQVLAKSVISADHPSNLAFIPSAPTEASTLFDVVVAASNMYGGAWLDSAGWVYAENQVLEWLGREAGLPHGAGGTFVMGGTIGNLSALVAARFAAREVFAETGREHPRRWKVACSAEAHASVVTAARVMDVDVVKVPVNAEGRMTGEALEAALAGQWDDVFAVVATAGTTNFGIVDDLAGIGRVARERDVWFHVDGAYGLAAMLAPSRAHLFAGVELADSFIVDPHKWLFAPFDACALVYRNPQLARRAHTQNAEYLDALTESDEWNPSDYGIHLSRRPRGLPLWFSLATHGVGAYREAIEANIRVAAEIGEEIRRRPELELVRDPELSMVVFTREGWSLDRYSQWSAQLTADGKGFVVPSSHNGVPNVRFAIVNPNTTVESLIGILDTMRD
jgi:L-2,4-diaminobutyrate decarboxylase